MRSAGSDAHSQFELGRGYVEMKPFQGRGGFLRAWAMAKSAARSAHSGFTSSAYSPKCAAGCAEVNPCSPSGTLSWPS
jgi:hypothetical protein